MTYPDVLTALMKMLHAGEKIESQVFALHLGMLKNLVVSSIDSDADRLRLIQGSKLEDEIASEVEEDSDEQMSEDD